MCLSVEHLQNLFLEAKTKIVVYAMLQTPRPHDIVGKVAREQDHKFKLGDTPNIGGKGEAIPRH